MAAVVQAEQDARRKFDGCGSHAEAGPALKVVQEGLQGLVQDLIRGLGRMDVTPARPVAGPGVQLLDVQALQGVLDIVGDSRPVGAVMTWAAQASAGSRRSGRAASNSSSTAAFSAADRASSADLLSLTCVPLFALGRSLLNFAGRAPERGQAGRAQRAELLKAGSGTGAQRQIQPGGQPFQGLGVVADVAVPDASLHIDPDGRRWLRRRACCHRSLAWGSCPDAVSFSASSHSISAPSAQPLRVASPIVRTASSTRGNGGHADNLSAPESRSRRP